MVTKKDDFFLNKIQIKRIKPFLMCLPRAEKQTKEQVKNEPPIPK